MKPFFNLLIIILFLPILTGCQWEFGQITSFLPSGSTPTTASLIHLPTSTAAPLSTITATPAPVPAIWVANPEDMTVLRIEPDSGEVSAVIQLDASADKLAAGEGAVWVLDQRLGRVLRIDPSRNQVTATIALPPGTPTAIAAGSGSVWVGLTGRIDLNEQTPGQEGEVLPPGAVVQIDPQNNKIKGQFPAQPVSQLIVQGNLLWVLSSSVIDNPLQVFDLETKQGMVVPLRNGPEWLPVDAIAVNEEHLWLYSAAYGKIFHADPSGQIRSAVSLEERQPVGHADLLAAESGLWAITTWGTVLHIDPNTNHILGQIDLNAPLTRLIAAPGAVWVLSQQTAAVFRIDPANTGITAQIATGSLLAATVVPTPTARMVLSKPCPDAATSRLKIGDIAYVTKDPPLPNRIREEPNVDSEIMGLINPGGGMEILDGPACSNGWVWWKVKNADYEGWTPEGDLETYWLIPLYQ